jgi:glucose-1-phosphate thymidylyltransferase
MNKKNILILAGGYGSRLYPITKFIPKIFLKFKKKYILDHHLQSLENFSVKNIYVNILNKKSYKRFLKKYSTIKNIKFIFENKPSGTAGILRKILLMENKLDLLIIYSDTVFENHQDDVIKKIIQYSGKKNISISSSYSNKKINNKGVLITKKNDVKKFIEKPNSLIRSKLYFSGLVYIPSNLNKNLLNFLDKRWKKNKVIDFSKEVLSTNVFKIKTYKTKVEPLDFGNWIDLIKNKFKK